MELITPIATQDRNTLISGDAEQLIQMEDLAEGTEYSTVGRQAQRSRNRNEMICLAVRSNRTSRNSDSGDAGFRYFGRKISASASSAMLAFTDQLMAPMLVE